MSTNSKDLGELHRKLKALEAMKRENKIGFFVPYPKQQDFFDMGIAKRERLLMAGNQLGKTEAGAIETVYHLTGIYPEGWLGRRFTKPVRWWAAGETSLVVRDVQQRKLCGEPGVADALGTGYIPKHLFLDKPSLARGVTDAFDKIQVKHVTGGTSVLGFKSYEQGRAKFQAETLDGIWFDEEPPLDIYTEGLTRTNATGGMVYMTFTPLKGMSSVVMRFLNEPSPDRGVVTMTIDDVTHISPEQKIQIIASYPPHEREARIKGIPMLGSGRIFPYSEESITEATIANVPQEWAKIWGIDFGIGHPFAAVLLAWDRDSDTVHILHTVRVADQKPYQHAKAMKPIGSAVPVAWPQDGTAREKGSGEEVSSLYRKEGLRMRMEHASWPEGGNSTERGILEMQQRMETGRLKVAAHLADWFAEYRLYHRKDGQIVKNMDDIMSATRVGIMDLRYAKAVALGGGIWKKRLRNDIAQGMDFDVFA